jgi:predicted ATPase
MDANFIKEVRLDSFLSFAPMSEPFELRPLNVVIGPNGSGKSNIFEAVELLKSTPTDFAAAIRDGGGPAEWLWKGTPRPAPAVVEVVVGGSSPTKRDLRYRLEFTASQTRVEVLDEAIEERTPIAGKPDVLFYYRFNRGRPQINVRSTTNGTKTITRRLEKDSLQPDQSVLAQRKDPDLYPEITWLGQRFSSIQSFRDWTFGRYAALRQPQPTDLPEDILLPDCRNLALILNQIEHTDGARFNSLLKKFFVRFERMSTRVSGGTVQFFLHETGFSTPIPPTRLSDGTIRFVALLATLLNPKPASLICIEEPELGLHPDAMVLIAELLKEASARTQLIVTTHSDSLVSALSDVPESIVVCERPGAGTVLRRLHSDRLTEWLNQYRLGDLWRMGELGANP